VALSRVWNRLRSKNIARFLTGVDQSESVQKLHSKHNSCRHWQYRHWDAFQLPITRRSAKGMILSAWRYGLLSDPLFHEHYNDSVVFQHYPDCEQHIDLNRCSDNCFPMRDFAGIWGNASDHEMNNLSSWRKKIRAGLFEWEDSPQNWRGHGKSQRLSLSYSEHRLLSNDFWINSDHYSFKSIHFFLTHPLLSKIFNFFDSHDDVGSVRPRFWRENWTLVNNRGSQRLKVLFLPRINQIWPAQSSSFRSNEIS
jgi:hypothetical protein